MKKHTLWLCLAAALLAASCSNDDEPVVENPSVVTDDDWISPDGQVVVQLGGYAPAMANTTVTRGTGDGPLDGTDAMTNKNIGVFALANGATLTNDVEDWATNTTYECLLLNVKGTWTATNSTDPVNSEEGAKKISLFTPDGDTDGAVYYYPMQGGQNYTFYGYYPYQEAQPDVEANTAKVTITTDGSQDIIWSKAEAPQIPSNTLWTIDNGGTPIKETSVLDGYNARYIRKIKFHNELVSEQSQYGQQEGDAVAYVPFLKFNHMLTQLKFFVVAAKDQSQEDIQNTKELRVKDIKLKEIENTAKLDITQGTIEWSNAGEIDMHIPGGWTNQGNVAEGNPGAYEFIPQDPADPEAAGLAMIKPGETSYTLELTIDAPQTGGAVGTPQTQTVTLNIAQAGDAAFEAGKYYNVKISLYAMQQVEVDATLADWEEGGEIVTPVE